MKKTFLLIITLLIILLFANRQLAYAEPHGIISIPCLKIEMPFYTASNKTEQAVIDDEQSALYYQWQNAYRIVDHAFSTDESGNEWNIQKIFSGSYVIVEFNGHKYFYECYLTAKTEYKYDQEFYNGRLLTPCSSYDILLSCCAEDSNHHFVAVFRRLSEFK